MTALRREMKIAQEKGMLKLPKMKSKMKKVGKIICDLGFHSMDSSWQVVATGCLQRLDTGHEG